MNWQLNKIQYPIYNLGEGKRIGIWVQGCRLKCKGCLNQTLWDKDGGKLIPVIDLFNWILIHQEGYDGITISGGEPFQQYEQLISFLHLVKTKTKLTVHCFSGYYLAELEELFPDRLFRDYIDVLVDGRYVAELHDNSNLKGSTNQTIYKFHNSVASIQNNVTGSKKWSIKVGKDDQIYMSGIPRKNELKNICDSLKQSGISKQFY